MACDGAARPVAKQERAGDIGVAFADVAKAVRLLAVGAFGLLPILGLLVALLSKVQPVSSHVDEPRCTRGS